MTAPTPNAPDIAKLMLDPVAMGLHSQLAQLLRQGLYEDDIVVMLCSAVAGVIGHAGEKIRREQLTAAVQGSLPHLVERMHLESRKTAGGIILPDQAPAPVSA